ncbi:hypothetical protein BD779DRAFT_1538318 [Infundibulicybe gibba]|nr:hypothetical protein BD779DRAFT_1538318 [Infundibulicybe gibba]
MHELTAPSYIITSALPGGISIAVTKGNYPRNVVAETGNKNQHVWSITRLPNGNYTLGTPEDTTSVSGSSVSGVTKGSMMSPVEWKITHYYVYGYDAHTIEEVGVYPPRYWVLGLRGITPGSEVSLEYKPPGAPDTYPGALWIFTTAGHLHEGEQP